MALYVNMGINIFERKLNSGNSEGTDSVFVVAEIGKNFIQTERERPHEEYIDNAKRLIDAAKEAGVDAVKFQTHEVEDEQADVDCFYPHFGGMDRFRWVSKNTDIASLKFWIEVKKHAELKGVVFFSTPMSRKAAIKLESIGVPFWKIGSGDIEDYVLLDYVSSTGKPIVISTGMVSKNELDAVVGFLKSKNVSFSILYCVSKYPCPKDKFNLSSIEYLRNKYPDVTIGFSNHNYEDSELDLAAIKLGARIIEKHFSFDRNMWGSDHRVSVTPEEMKNLVELIKKRKYASVDVEPYYGNIEAEFDGANNEFRSYFKKTLVAGRDIKEGETINKEMVYAMRPASYLKGLSSNYFISVLGKRAAKHIKKFTPLNDALFK